MLLQVVLFRQPFFLLSDKQQLTTASARLDTVYLGLFCPMGCKSLITESMASHSPIIWAGGMSLPLAS